MADSTSKESLRRILLQRRNAIPADYARIASKKIHSGLNDIDAFSRARRMALYHPVGSEVQTQEIMRDAISRGVQVLLPRILGDDLVFCAVGGPEDLEMGRFGIMVPKERCPTCCDMDVVVVPAVGVAPDGHRLGYGYGYYDRFLGGSGATSIAVAYRRQVVESIPFDGHDVRVHWVATENGAFRADHRAA